MKRIIIIILIIFCLGCAKKAEVQKIDECHWKMKGSKGVETTIKTEDYEVSFDTEQDPPKVESKGGFGETIKNLPIISWLPFI